MEMTLGKVVRVALALLVALHSAIASPVVTATEECLAHVTETVFRTHTSTVLLPASTVTSKMFQRGQPSNSTVLAAEASASTTNTVIARDSHRSLPRNIEDPLVTGTPCADAVRHTEYKDVDHVVHAKQNDVTSYVTIYPCATPIPSMTPTIPYGKFSDALGNPGDTMGNNLIPLSDPRGATAEACCETCWFESTYCIAAYWFFYEGCVVNQGVVSNGLIGSGVPVTGSGVSDTCPQGLVEGLYYGPDSNTDPRSTGNFAGPCGVGYSDL